MLTDDDIKNRTTYHAPSEDGKARHQQLSDAFGRLMAVVDNVVPDGREKAIVFTKLEEGKMWASAGVARNPETV